MSEFSSLDTTQRAALTLSDELDPDQRLPLVGDLLLTLMVQLGESKMKLRDLLSLRSASVVALDVFAGEPLEIYVNHRLIAKGEAVVVNDRRMGIRLTDIVTPSERIGKSGNRAV
jgi:flagellar motor switch protein FliN/FliY